MLETEKNNIIFKELGFRAAQLFLEIRQAN